MSSRETQTIKPDLGDQSVSLTPESLAGRYQPKEFRIETAADGLDLNQ